MDHYDGIAISLGCIRTHQSLGIGSYLDLIPLIDLCEAAKFNIIQLLPIQDTQDDPSPYNAISATAFHPIYLSLTHILLSEEERAVLKAYDQEERLNYHGVLQTKLSLLKQDFMKHLEEYKNNALFHQFIESSFEVRAYAAYKVLRELYPNRSITSWPAMYANGNADTIHTICHEKKDDFLFYCYLQFLAEKELEKVKAYADQKGILLKCDLPMMMSPDSHEVWCYESYFRKDLVAGTPPDAFNPEGQYWGFPLYNWHNIESSHYHFWKIRFQNLERFFHVARLDHVIGFFRLYGIPHHKSPKYGHFIPSSEFEALHAGDEHLKALVSLTTLQLIGEDLGTCFPGMKDILKKHGIAQTKMARWEKVQGHFEKLSHYPYLSLISLSNHDIPLLAGWWDEEPKERKQFVEMLGLDPTLPLSHDLRYAILKAIHHAPSKYRINPIQEYTALKPNYCFSDSRLERINIPGKILNTNWTYRMKVTIEVLSNDKTWLETIASIVS